MIEPTVTQSLAAMAARLRGRELSSATRGALTRTLLDWFGVAIGGSADGPAATLARGLAGGGPSRLVGRGGSADPALAAFVNGTAAHTLELDDIYAPGLVHPGAPVVAAAFAVADLVGASGAQLERAVLAGIEAACRVGADLGPRHYRRWHTTGTAGALGAAVAAAGLLDLDPDRAAHAIALSATLAGGLQQTFRRDAAGKPLHAGHAAQSGVVAAVAAAGGVTGALDALEGEAGLAAATGTTTSWPSSREAAVEAPLIEQLTIKPYPCCGHAFAAIDAALALRHDGLVPGQVERIEVSTYSTALEVAGNPDPQTVPAARFSIGFAVAMALLEGRVTRDCFSPASIDDGARRALTERVTLIADPDFDAAFPARRGATLTITSRDGQVLSRTVPDRSGSPGNPLSEEAVSAKFAGLAEPVLGASAAAELARCLRSLGDLASVRELMVARGGGV